nr:aminoacetone oxidase family FAD-binding enzyme [Lachnospiraceae bacterium]
MKKHVIVLGGGASGIMAAITAAESGAHVTVLESNNKIGKKLYATGNGRCNFTNLNMNPECFRTDSDDSYYSVIKRFGCDDTIEFFEKTGLNHKDRDGYVYPNNDQAASLVHMLEKKIDSLNIQVNLEEKCTDFVFGNNGEIEVTTNKGKYIADRLIVACGLKASPKTGSDGNLLKLLSKKGYQFSPVVPALVPLVFKSK